jgi:hypothetical protein
MKGTESFVLTVVEHLLQSKVQHAMDLLLPWLAAQGPSGLHSLLAACPQWGLERLTVLLSDVIETYPRRLVASPALICVHPAECVARVKAGSFFTHEPYPSDKDAFRLRGPADFACDEASDSGLRFLGWLPATDTYPFARSELVRTHEVVIPWGRVATVVAVFEWETQNDEAVPSVCPTWWPQFFVQTDCLATITAPRMLGYAKAAEYARAMQATSDHALLHYFLAVEEQSQAQRDGDAFRRDCEIHFPQRR